MFVLRKYIENAHSVLPQLENLSLEEIIRNIPNIVEETYSNWKDSSDFIEQNGILVHKEATVELGAVVKGPAIISKDCFVGAHAYIRGGVFLGEGAVVGPSTEVKTSLLFARASVGHLSFVGDSLVGSDVDVEAGTVFANHYNERKEKNIAVVINNQTINTTLTKFGALVGDRSCIGANAVLSPGTVLERESIIGRLELVKQVP